MLTEYEQYQVTRFALPIFAYYGTAQAMQPFMSPTLFQTGTISRHTEPLSVVSGVTVNINRVDIFSDCRTR